MDNKQKEETNKERKMEHRLESHEAGLTDEKSKRINELMKQAREAVYEIIAIQSGDSVENVMAFYAEIEKDAEEGKQSEQKRQSTVFTNMLSTENLVGVCLIIGYQKENADKEKTVPMKMLTSRIIEPLGVEILASAVMHIENTKHGIPEAKVVEVESPERMEEVKAEIVSEADAPTADAEEKAAERFSVSED